MAPIMDSLGNQCSDADWENLLPVFKTVHAKAASSLLGVLTEPQMVLLWRMSHALDPFTVAQAVKAFPTLAYRKTSTVYEALAAFRLIQPRRE